MLSHTKLQDTDTIIKVSYEGLQFWSHMFTRPTDANYSKMSRNLNEKEKKKKKVRDNLKRLLAEPFLVIEPSISHGHVIKGSCGFLGRSRSK